MKTNRILKLCAVSFICGVFLFGFTWRWIILPTGHPIPVIYPKPLPPAPTSAAAGFAWDLWQQAIVQPALWAWGSE